MENTLQIDVDDAVQHRSFAEQKGSYGSSARDSSVVDQDVHAAEIIDHFGDCPIHLSAIGNIHAIHAHIPFSICDASNGQCDVSICATAIFAP